MIVSVTTVLLFCVFRWRKHVAPTDKPPEPREGVPSFGKGTGEDKTYLAHSWARGSQGGTGRCNC